jgi:hypothetical protein
MALSEFESSPIRLSINSGLLPIVVMDDPVSRLVLWFGGVMVAGGVVEAAMSLFPTLAFRESHENGLVSFRVGGSGCAEACAVGGICVEFAQGIDGRRKP